MAEPCFPTLRAGPGAARRDSHALTRLTASEGRPGTRQGLCSPLPKSHPSFSLGRHPRPLRRGGGVLPALHSGFWGWHLLMNTLSREQQREAYANLAAFIFTGAPGPWLYYQGRL